MATGQTSKVLRPLRRAVLQHAGAGLTDGQLLGCFVEQRDEAAFAALVRRHGPMVWGVCRRLLGHHDAEDAFQAAFVVLARKAASLRRPEELGNWLYGVAHRAALQARRGVVRRRGRERPVGQVPEPEAAAPNLADDLLPLLDAALGRLPDKYRAAVVLCDLEGKTRKEAARQLGVPEGTVAGRLARARALLAKRLARHGPAASAAVVAAALPRESASASLAARGVIAAAAKNAAAGTASSRVVALTEGVLRTMFLTKLKAALATAFVVALACGAGLLVSRAQDPEKRAAAPAAAPRGGPPLPRDLLLQAEFGIAPSSANPSSPPPLKDFLLALDKQLWDAAAKGDWQVYQTLVADDYVGFSSLYGRDDKRTVVAATKRRRYSDRVIRDVEFLRVSKDVAILSYVYDCRVREGPVTQHYRNHRASMTWAQRDGAWVVVFSQDMAPPVAAPGEFDRGNAKEAQSLYRRSVEEAQKLWAERRAVE
jgi:RNA polymerase sigma factor (sigma-70 family)